MDNVVRITPRLTKAAAEDVEMARRLKLPADVIAHRFERFNVLWAAALAEANIGDEEQAA